MDGSLDPLLDIQARTFADEETQDWALLMNSFAAGSSSQNSQQCSQQSDYLHNVDLQGVEVPDLNILHGDAGDEPCGPVIVVAPTTPMDVAVECDSVADDGCDVKPSSPLRWELKADPSGTSYDSFYEPSAGNDLNDTPFYISDVRTADDFTGIKDKALSSIDAVQRPSMLRYEHDTNSSVGIHTPRPCRSATIATASLRTTTTAKEEFTDEYLLTVSTPAFNQRIKTATLSAEQVRALKKRRRTLKNRGYARSCRERHSGHDEEHGSKVDSLRQRMGEVTRENERLREELKQLRAKYDELASAGHRVSI